MQDLYRCVTELPEDCIDTLRQNIYWDDQPEEFYIDYPYFWSIPDEMVFELYTGVMFVPEDFYTGAGDDWNYASHVLNS